MTLPTLPENYRRVLNLIRVGADNPITGAEIALILKLEERTVQRYCQSLNHTLRHSYHRYPTRL